jgi:hypothetical protein
VSGWLILFFFLWVTNPFSSFTPFSNSSIRYPVLSPMVGCGKPFVFVRLWQSLSGDSSIRLLSARASWHQQQYLGFVSADGMDP